MMRPTSLSSAGYRAKSRRRVEERISGAGVVTHVAERQDESVRRRACDLDAMRLQRAATTIIVYGAYWLKRFVIERASS